MLDWNDLRHFLAVARHGSTLKAAQALRTSQTTVARRIAALERAAGVTLFEKRPAGYGLTPAGQALVAPAEAVERAAEDFAGRAAAQARELGGTVKVTMEEVFAVTLIAPLLRELHERHPEIHIDLDTSRRALDLGAGEADIALRSTKDDQPAGVVGRSLGRDDWALYCSRDYAAAHGAPTSLAELRKHPLIGGGGGDLWRQYQAWLQRLGLESQVAMHHGSSTGLLSAVRAGIGITVLPCIVADGDPGFVRCLPPRSDHGRVLWLLTHERVRHTPAVRLVADFLYERLKAHATRLERAAA